MAASKNPVLTRTLSSAEVSTGSSTICNFKTRGSDPSDLQYDWLRIRARRRAELIGAHRNQKRESQVPRSPYQNSRRVPELRKRHPSKDLFGIQTGSH